MLCLAGNSSAYQQRSAHQKRLSETYLDVGADVAILALRRNRVSSEPEPATLFLLEAYIEVDVGADVAVLTQTQPGVQ